MKMYVGISRIFFLENPGSFFSKNVLLVEFTSREIIVTRYNNLKTVTKYW